MLGEALVGWDSCMLYNGIYCYDVGTLWDHLCMHLLVIIFHYAQRYVVAIILPIMIVWGNIYL